VDFHKKTRISLFCWATVSFSRKLLYGVECELLQDSVHWV
jgi:hypothetical protein